MILSENIARTRSLCHPFLGTSVPFSADTPPHPLTPLLPPSSPLPLSPAYIVANVTLFCIDLIRGIDSRMGKSDVRFDLTQINPTQSVGRRLTV